jgi:disulfide oxidoreductase YuzD
MKKLIVLSLLLSFSATITFGQKSKPIEIYYFKAELACCRAKACDALENDLKLLIEQKFPDKSVVFKRIKITDEANKSLVEKYKAESQTVIICKKKRSRELFFDVSEIVKEYAYNEDKAIFERELMSKISEIKNK